MLTRIRPALFPLCAAAAILLAAQARGAAFQNGSFETANPPYSDGFETLAGGSTVITGWTVRADSVDYINSYWNAEDGSYSLDLDGNAPGGIEQTFDTTPGQAYTATFYLAGNPACGSTIKQLNVWASGNPTSHYSFDVTGHSTGSMGWQQERYTFVASGPSTTLVFQSADTGGGCGPALDNVSVAEFEPVPAVSPVGAATLALLLAAAGCAALARRLAA